MYLVKTPKIIRSFYKSYYWQVNTKNKELYLTFDDGPTPEITEFVLDTLKKYNAQATFFCIGKNIENHPELFSRIVNESHSVGNHTQNHLNGWQTTTLDYLVNVKECQSAIAKIKQLPNTKLFRPPYGRIKRTQAKKLINKGYKIIMWSVLSGDFDVKLSKNKCLENVINTTTNGDIVVFHDSVKASEKLQYVLPLILDYFTKKGYEFKAL